MSLSRLAHRARGTLIAAVALALLGTLVVGSEDRRREAELAVAKVPSAVVNAKQQLSDEDLDLAKLQRAKATARIVDVFQERAAPAPILTAVPVPAKVEPSPPPPAEAPTLPFRFIGRFSEDGVVRVLLARAEHEYHLSGGETIDGLYSVDEISEGAIVFTYLPLKLRQTLLLPPTSEGNQ